MKTTKLRAIIAAVLALMLAVPAAADGLLAAETLGAAAGGTHAPTAADIECETVKNIAVTGSFAGADADGGELTYVITVQPKKGDAAVSPTDPTKFVYTPKTGKTGSDSFSYIAVDADGRRSNAATVKVRITKNAAKMTYADMDGNPAHLAAIRLAENGVLIGERLGKNYYFSPDKTVTRGEFIAMVVTCLDIDVPATSSTGFADDAATPAWQRAYIAAARRAGLVRGSTDENGRAVFGAGRVMTRAEAAVVLANALALPTVTSAQVYEDMESVPAWAEGAVNGALAAGLISRRADGTLGVLAPLSRADTAEMLYAAMTAERAAETTPSILTRIFT